MKRLKLLLVLQFIALGIFAQSPQLINYQGVARDGNGVVLKNKNIGIKFEFRQGPSVSSPTLFVEEQNLTTNNLGLFSTQIGKNNSSGLSQVNWTNGSVFLRIGIDTTGGTIYIDLGSSQQLVSVPYAMHAENVPASYAGNILTVGKQSFTLSSSSSTIDIQQGTNVSVNGAYPNYTISATPTLNLSAPGTLSISGGNTVDITPTLTLNGNVLSVGPGSNSVTLPTGTASALSGTATGIATVTTSGNSFTVDVPAQVQQTIVPQGIAQVTNGVNSATINVPNPVLTVLPSNSLTINGGNSVSLTQALGITSGSILNVGPTSNSIILPSAAPISGTGTGVASVTTSANNFTVNVPNPVLTVLPSNSLTINGGNSVSLTQALGITSGSILNVGPTSNSIILPSAAPISGTGTGVASVTTSANNFTVNVPNPVLTVLPSNSLTINGGNSVSLTQALGITSGSILNVGPTSNSIILPSAAPISGTGTGVASVTTSANNFTVNVPNPVLTVLPSNSLTINGGNSVSLTQALGITSGSILNVGPTSNSIILPSAAPISGTGTGVASVTTSANNFTVDVPAQVQQTIVPQGIAQVTNGVNSATINVPNPVLTILPSNSLTINGGNSVSLTQALGITSGSILNVGPTSNSIILPSAAPISGTGTGVASVTTSANSFTVDVPAQVQQTIVPQGIAQVTNGVNSATINVPNPVLTVLPSNSLTINGGNSVSLTQALGITSGSILNVGPTSNSIILPSAAPISGTGTGVASVTTSANSFTVDVPAQVQQTIVPQGIAQVTNGVNSATINVPNPVLTVLPSNSLTINGGNSVSLTQALGITSGSILNVGPTSNSIILPSAAPISGTGTGVASVTTSANSFTVDVPAQVQQTIVPQGIAQVTNGVNSATINVPNPVLTVLPSNSLTINGGNSVSLTQALGITSGSILNVGPTSNSIALPVSPTYSAGAGISLASGSITNTAPDQPVTIGSGGIVSVTGAYPNFLISAPVTTISGQGMASVSPLTGNNFSINVPNPTLTILPSNSLTINGGNSVLLTQTLGITSGSILNVGPTSNSIALPAAANASIVSTGMANTATLGPNSYSIDVPNPTLTILPSNSLTINGGNSVLLTQTLGITSGSILNVGPTSNSITLPVSPTYSAGTGISLASGSITNTAPDQVVSIGSGGIVSVSGTYPSFIVTAPVTTITGQGMASVNPLTGNNFSINVPNPTLTILPSNSLTINGGNSVLLTQTLGITSGSILNVGPASNSIALPAAANASIISTGMANTATLGPNSYSIDVPNPTLTILPSNSLTINGGNSVLLTQTLGITSGSILNVGPTSNSITLPVSPTYSAGTGISLASGSITNTAPDQVVSIGSGGIVSVSGTYPSFIVTAPVTTITGQGMASVNPLTGNNFSINVPNPTLTILPSNSLTINGGNSVLLTQTLGITSGSILNVGPASNTIALPTQTAQTLAYNTNSLNISNGNTVVIAPTLGYTNGTLTVGPASNTIALPTQTAQTLAYNTNSLNISNGNTVVIAPTLSHTSGTLTVGPASNTISIVQALTFSNGVITSGPSSNSIAINSGTNSAWSTLGNVGTSTLSNFMGTTDGTDLNFRVNNFRAGRIENSGSTYFGYFSGPTINTIIDNTGFGRSTLRNNVNGHDNSAVGNLALFGNTDGAFNTAVGSNAMLSNTTGSSNVAFGFSALNANLIGNNNTAIGRGALNLNTSNDNVALGYYALNNNSTGTGNTALGLQAGENNLVGSNNVFIGKNAGRNETGSDKLYVANSAGTPLIYGDFVSGQIGLGTISPTEDLQIQKASTVDLSLISGATSMSSIRFGYSGNHYMGTIRYNNSNNSMDFWTNNTPGRIVIDNSGFVGINTAIPTEILHVTGNIRFSGALMAANQAGTLGQVLTSAGPGNAPIWQNASSLAWSTNGNAGTTASNFLGTSDAQPLSIRTNSVERIRILSAGNVGVGTAAPTNTFEVAGNALFRDAVNTSTGYVGTFSNSTNGISGGALAVINVGTRTIGHDGMSINNLTTKNGGNNSTKTGLTINSTGAWGTGGSGGHVNVGLSVNVSGGVDGNYSGIFTGGNFGIGVSAPSTTFAIGNGTTEKFNINGTNGDMNFLDDQASITFPVPGGSPAPMIYMFSNGTGNTDRMAISHSSNYPTYGLQYQDNGDRFNFLSNGSPVLTADLGTLRVGVGTLTPTEKLEVVGNVKVPAANDYMYNGTKTKYATISAASFASINGLQTDGTSTGNARWISSGLVGTADNLYGTIQLPNSATVTGIEAYVYDNDALRAMTVDLVSFNMSSNSISIVATTGSSGVAAIPGITIISDLTVNAVVNNSSNSYFLRVNTYQANANLWIRGVRVTYLVDRAD